MSGKLIFRSLAILAAFAAFASGGCSTFHLQQLDVLHVFGSRTPKPPAEGGPGFELVLLPAQGKPQSLRMALDKPLTVQEALKQCGALRKFRREEIFLERTVPQAGRTHRMPINFDRAEQAVTAETDYALYPGDRLIVKEDTTTVFDDTLKSVTNSLGVLNR
jgi:hypothetical protein